MTIMKASVLFQLKKKNTINLEMFASVQLVFYYKMVFTYH